MKRAAVRKIEPPAPTLGGVVELPLSEIVGIDPCNARRIEPTAETIAQIAAGIAERGLLNPLVVRGCPGRWLVLAGGCRWRALKTFVRSADVVRCRVFDGDDEAAAALSLEENIDRQDLHPLEEADRVAEMAAHQSLAEVARRLGRPERWARQRLALSNLPEVARAAWLAGEIDLVRARALTTADGRAVEHLFANPQAAAILSDARMIRSALLPKGVPATAPAARFVGVETYVKAGGAVIADLFEDRTWLLDIELLRRLERQKLAAEAALLCETEGWGDALFDPVDAARVVAGDFTAAERAEVAELMAKAEGQPEYGEHDARADAIHRRALLRAIPETDRAQYGVYVGLDSEGRLDVARGVFVDNAARAPQTPPADVDEAGARAGAAASERPAEAAEPLARRPHPAPPATAPILHADARRIADMSATRALALLVHDMLPLDVLRILIGALVAKGRPAVAIARQQGPGGRPDAFLAKLARLDQASALEVLAEAADPEIEDASTAIAAMSVDLRRTDDETARGTITFAEGASGKRLAPVFADLCDYGAFFAAAGRSVSLDAIRDCGGPAAASERSWMKDKQIAEEAALLARAKCWLPDYLRASEAAKIAPPVS